MYQPLAPCPACSRHIKTAEPTCPFCKASLPEAHAVAAIPGATSRLSRAAAFAFTASLAVSGASVGAAGCSGGVATPSPSGDASSSGDASGDAAHGPSDEGGVQPVYGAPAYGGPPVDSGSSTDASGD